MGEMTKTFIGIGKEEQADIKPEDAKHATNVATLLGIDCEWMVNYFCKPKLKVGVEWVTKGQTVVQAAASVAGIARSLSFMGLSSIRIIMEQVMSFKPDKQEMVMIETSLISRKGG